MSSAAIQKQSAARTTTMTDEHHDKLCRSSFMAHAN